MPSFDGFMKMVRGLFGMLAFGLALAVALCAGVDPLWAIFRAVAASVTVCILFSLLCRSVVPLLTAVLGEEVAAPDHEGQSA